MPRKAKDAPAPIIKEADFQRTVTTMAAFLGWRYHHEATSFGSKPGWPDLALFHPAHGAVYLELKVGKNKPTENQLEWITWLQQCGQRAYIVYPSQLDQIEALLSGQAETIDEPQLPLLAS